MLTEKSVLGPKGEERFDLPQLDRFDRTGEPFNISYRATEKEERYGSEAGAWESHIDNYLGQIAPYIVKVGRLTGAKAAMSLILNAQDEKVIGKKHKHDRLYAAKFVAEKIVPPMLKVKSALRGADIYLHWDCYEPGLAWVWYRAEFTGLCIAVVDGRLIFGEGDGYHRAAPDVEDDGDTWEDERDGSIQVNRSYDPADSVVVREAILKEAKRLLRVDDSPCPCDEKYWHYYQRIKPMLERRLKRKKARLKKKKKASATELGKAQRFEDKFKPKRKAVKGTTRRDAALKAWETRRAKSAKR
jgi:hypothetical protein